MFNDIWRGSASPQAARHTAWNAAKTGFYAPHNLELLMPRTDCRLTSLEQWQTHTRNHTSGAKTYIATLITRMYVRVADVCALLRIVIINLTKLLLLQYYYYSHYHRC